MSMNMSGGVEEHATYRLSDRGVTRERGGVNPARTQPNSTQAGVESGPLTKIVRGAGMSTGDMGRIFSFFRPICLSAVVRISSTRVDS